MAEEVRALDQGVRADERDLPARGPKRRRIVSERERAGPSGGKGLLQPSMECSFV
jgi:hypothetical protein